MTKRTGLGVLEATGLSRSEAIRTALVGEVRHRRRQNEIASQGAGLEAGEDDRDKMRAVAELMETRRASR